MEKSEDTGRYRLSGDRTDYADGVCSHRVSHYRWYRRIHWLGCYGNMDYHKPPRWVCHRLTASLRMLWSSYAGSAVEASFYLKYENLILLGTKHANSASWHNLSWLTVMDWFYINSHTGTRKGAWSPKYDVKRVPIGTEQYIYKQWLQVNLAKPTLIQSVTTKGSASSAEYVVEYSLQYSYDKPYNFQNYIGTGDTKKPVVGLLFMNIKC